MSALFLNVGEVVLSYVAFFFSFLLSLSFSFESKLAGKGSAEQNGSTSKKYIYIYTHIKRAKSRTVLFFLLSLTSQCGTRRGRAADDDVPFFTKRSAHRRHSVLLPPPKLARCFGDNNQRVPQLKVVP